MANGFTNIKNGLNVQPKSADPSSAVEGDLYYSDGTARPAGLWQYKSGAWTAIGGAGSGGFNYIENADAETDVTGWTRYANTSASSKPDNFGGTPSGSMTFTRTTSTPLNGDASFLLTKDAADRQGEGVYYEFTAQEGHKTLKLLLSMLADTSNANITDSDLAIYLVGSNDNFASDFLVIEPNNPAILAGVPQIFKQLQLNAAKTKYRLCIHIASTNATAYTAKFDDVVFGPSSVATGALVSDSKAYTPTTQGLGTISGATFQYSRVGEYLEVEGAFITGTVTASTAQLYLPSGLVIASDSGRTYSGEVIRAGGTRVTVVGVPGRTYMTFGSGGASQGDVVGSSLFGSSESLLIRFRVKIVGWSSNTASSEDLGGRDIKVNLHKNATQSITTGVVTYVTFDSSHVELDTASSFDDANDAVEVLETGYYDLSAVVRFASAASGQIETGFYINDVILVDSAQVLASDSSISQSCALSLSGVFLNKGDLINVYAFQTSGGNLDVTRARFHVSKNSSSQTILESETVAAHYTSNSGQAIGSTNTTLKFEDIVYDTHSSYNTSTGTYTIPVSGKYIISLKYGTASATWTSGDSANSIIVVNSVEKSLSFIRLHAVTTAVSVPHNTIVLDLNKGDTVTATGANAQSAAMSTGSTLNNFSIARIK